MKVLVLGGTTEARALSHHLDARADMEVVVSLAGRTSAPAEYGGTTRVGGFGGVDALQDHLTEAGYAAVVDATHPFASTMSAHLVAAAGPIGVPHLRFERPPWRAQAGDRWTEVDGAPEAASSLTILGTRRALLTIGRSELDAFAGVRDVHFVVRSIEHVDDHGLDDAVFIRARSPFTLDDEIALLEEHAIDTLVTKNSGGDDAKLVAARALHLDVVMIHRPAGPGGPVVEDLDDVVRWLRSVERAG